MSFRIDRNGAAVDFLVLFLAAFLLLFWILGHIYLTFYPMKAGTSLASNSGLIASTQGTIPGSAKSDQSEAVKKSDDGSEDTSSDGSVENNSAENSTKSPAGSDEDFSEQLQQQTKELQSEFEEKLAAEKQQMNSDFESKLENQKQNLQEQFDADLETERDQITATLKAEYNDLLTKAMEEAKSEQPETSVELGGEFPEMPEPNDAEKIAAQKKADESAAIAQELRAQVNELTQQLATQSNEMESKSLTMEDLRSQVASLKEQIQLSDNSSSAKPGPSKASAVEPVDNELSLTPPAKTLTPKNGYRLWTGSNGRQVELGFVRFENEMLVFVDRKQVKYVLPVKRFSAEDQAYIQTLK